MQNHAAISEDELHDEILCTLTDYNKVLCAIQHFIGVKG